MEEMKKDKEGKKQKEEYAEEQVHFLEKQIDQLNKILANSNLKEFVQLLENRKKILWTNILAGIARGIGIGIGVTVITAVLVMLLQKIVTLNIPIIGEYIADIVEIVQKSR